MARQQVSVKNSRVKPHIKNESLVLFISLTTEFQEFVTCLFPLILVCYNTPTLFPDLCSNTKIGSFHKMTLADMITNGPITT